VTGTTEANTGLWDLGGTAKPNFCLFGPRRVSEPSIYVIACNFSNACPVKYVYPRILLFLTLAVWMHFDHVNRKSSVFRENSARELPA
jgi:hypothetical protein